MGRLRRSSLGVALACGCQFGTSGATGEAGSESSDSAPADASTGAHASVADDGGSAEGANATTNEPPSRDATSSTSDAPSSDAQSSDATTIDATTGPCAEPPSWYPDADGDGFGDPARGTTSCDAPTGDHVEDGSDCDDGDDAINPDADEVCDGIDNDCDAGTDEGSAANLACGGCTFLLAQDGRSWFALCPGPLDWPGSRDACEAFGPSVDLAWIDTSTDQDALLAIVGGDAWIGLNDLEEDNHWVWIDGTDSIVDGGVVGFDGWGELQPDGPGVEHCGELDPGFLGWNDVDCGQAQPFICRHPI